MKRKMVWIAGAVLILVLLVLGIIAGIKYYNLQNAVVFDLQQEEVEESDELVVNAQLIAIVENEQEAQELADLYGITLLRVVDTLAVFETSEDPRSVVRKGKENEWKELAVDEIYYSDGN